MHASIGSLWLWLGFTAFVLAMLVLDLGVFHRKAHAVSVKEALLWTLVWIALALTYDVGISLVVIAALLGGTVIASILTSETRTRADEADARRAAM